MFPVLALLVETVLLRLCRQQEVIHGLQEWDIFSGGPECLQVSVAGSSNKVEKVFKPGGNLVHFDWPLISFCNYPFRGKYQLA